MRPPARIVIELAGEQERPVYALRLEAQPGHTLHQLRAVLKILLRRYRLRCIGLQQEQK